MIHTLKRDLKIWWGCKKLNRLVRQAKQKREQALKGRDQRGRFVSKAQWRIG